jgi:hypothetical protein
MNMLMSLDPSKIRASFRFTQRASVERYARTGGTHRSIFEMRFFSILVYLVHDARFEVFTRLI